MFNASWWVLVEISVPRYRRHRYLVKFRHISHYVMISARAQERDLFLDRNSTPARITQSFYPVLNLRGGTELYISALYKPHVCYMFLTPSWLNMGVPVPHRERRVIKSDSQTRPCLWVWVQWDKLCTFQRRRLPSLRRTLVLHKPFMTRCIIDWLVSDRRCCYGQHSRLNWIDT